VKRRLLELWGRLPIPLRLRWWLAIAVVDKIPVGVAGVILNQAGQVLMFRHTYRGQFPWGLPSGWLKAFEDPAAGLARELAEEAGLIVRVTRPLLARSGSVFKRLDLVYQCEWVEGEFRPSAEVAEMGWFAHNSLPVLMHSQYDMMNQIFAILDAN
jgi:ADP-ribose pyrophosphatase YjhB (NUDIX family)